MKSPQGLAGKISLGRSLGYSDLPSGKSEASLGSRAAPRDFPRANYSANGLYQPLCENCILLLAFMSHLFRSHVWHLSWRTSVILAVYSCKSLWAWKLWNMFQYPEKELVWTYYTPLWCKVYFQLWINPNVRDGQEQCQSSFVKRLTTLFRLKSPWLQR